MYIYFRFKDIILHSSKNILTIYHKNRFFSRAGLTEYETDFILFVMFGSNKQNANFKWFQAIRYIFQ